ncbi:MAG TPA: hypothetical protein VLH08_20585, partial [Acidobacteriota bacterium]|nr:hypothetical protein [Acidobacteriota bacterium]
MPRIGNEPQMRPIELPQEEHIGQEVPEIKQNNHQELEHPVRASSSPSTQAAEKAIGAQAQQTQLNRQLLENRANAIHQACEGLGTDEAAVFRNLSGLSSEERKQLD